jgi:hypothetical protein
MRIVHKAKSVAKYYYWIKHDKDFYGDASEDVENPHKPGELKKSHIHLLFTFNSSRDISTVQNYFKEFEELKENSFELIHNAYGAKRYLTHADNPEKYQYQIIEVETNDNLYPDVFIKKQSSSEEIISILNSYENANSLSVKDYCLNFSSILENLNTYQKMVVISNLRKEWRLLNFHQKDRE